MSDPMKVCVEIEVQEIADAIIRQLTEDGTLVKVVRCKYCVHHRKCMLQHFVESNAVDGAKIDWNKWYCPDGIRGEE